jgi:hypothetical protein
MDDTVLLILTSEPSLVSVWVGAFPRAVISSVRNICFCSVICFERRYVVVVFDQRTMDAALLNDLSSLSNDQTNWKCKLLVDDLDEQGRPIKTDLVQYLFPNLKAQLEKQQFNDFPPKSWYRFSAKYNGMDGRKLVIKMIQESANESGFSLINTKK